MRQQETDRSSGEAGRQLELPLSRDKKLEIAALLKIRDPPVISKVRQRNLANLVGQIELNSGDDGFFRGGQEVLAAKLEVDPKTLRKWITDAYDLRILKAEGRDGFGGNAAYGVDWFAVGRLVRSDGPATAASVQEAPIAHDSAAFIIDRPAHSPVKSPVSPGVFPAPLPLPSFSNENTSFTSNHYHYGDHPELRSSDFFPVSPGVFRLSIEDLANPDRVDEWIQWAVATGDARECDRHRIFAAAHSIVRRAIWARRHNKPAPGPGAFISNVRHRNWYASQADDDWASKVLLYLQRQESELC